MGRRKKCLLLCVVSSALFVYVGKVLLKKSGSDVNVGIVSVNKMNVNKINVNKVNVNKVNVNKVNVNKMNVNKANCSPVAPETAPVSSIVWPGLVWREGDHRYPHFLSPILQFENDIFRHRTGFNLTGIYSLYTAAQRRKKLIVFYNMPAWHTMEERYKNSLEKCPVKSCQLTASKSLLSKADGVIFYIPDIRENITPPPRSSNQMWIFFSHEPPVNFPNEKWDYSFNWTLTYRLDSDIVCPYFVLIPKSNPDVRNFKSLAQKKSAPVAWLVSNCNARSKRGDYVKELQKYIDVDIYGRCGPLDCPRSRQGDCDAILNEKYKFYLAFENSLCRGYITEKLFRCYTLDIIPVVRGGARYGDLLPLGTYINTADFSSPKHLAEYLNYLDCNDTAYAEILERKSQFTITDPEFTLDSSLCDICIKLHDLNRFSNTYSYINKWWNGDSCHQATDL